MEESFSKTQEEDDKMKFKFISIFGDVLPSVNVPQGHPSRAFRGVEPWTDDGGGGWTTDARTDDGRRALRSTHAHAHVCISKAAVS